jgi:uncharacterized cupredoxin-like copper-binding protein
MRNLSARLTAAIALALGTSTAPLGAQLPRVVTVRAYEYRFEAPESVPAGAISFRLENDGKEVHHLWLVQIRDGKTFDDLLKAMDAWTGGGGARMPDWAVDVGGPNEASPGVNADATVTLEPGSYAMVCYVPSPDGGPHVMKGMVKQLRVTAQSAGAAREPKADVTLRLTDYAFELSKRIASGLRVIRIENAGPQPHEVIIGRLLPNKSMSEALTWLNEGQHGSAPVVAIGGASGLANGRHEIITVSFEPGRYVLLCFIPDVKDGKPHTEYGMAKEFNVVRTTAMR